VAAVFIVTHNNGRVWSVHTIRALADAEHARAAAAAAKAAPGTDDYEFYASGVEEHDVDVPGPA